MRWIGRHRSYPVLTPTPPSEASQGGVREAAVSKMSLEAVEERESSQVPSFFFLHFFLFYFLAELFESGKAECPC